LSIGHPSFIPDWRALQRLGLNWRGVDRNIAALCLYLQPGTPPLPPMYTQFHPRSPNPGAPDTARFSRGGGGRHPRIGRGSQPQKDKTQRNPRCGFCSSRHQVPVDRYPTASFSLSHARTSSSAQDMSFATLCLTRVHVFSTGWGQLTKVTIEIYLIPDKPPGPLGGRFSTQAALKFSRVKTGTLAAL
jgi:hypothetical protein